MSASVRERLYITTGITGGSQEGAFMNATLQSAATHPDLEFSVAVSVEVPFTYATEDDLAVYLRDVFTRALRAAPELHVEIQLGPAGDPDENVGLS